MLSLKLINSRTYRLLALGTFLCVVSAPAFAQETRHDFVRSLNENNIRAFLQEVSEISTGQRSEMLDDDVINYFNNHMSDKGLFKSKMSYDIPGFPMQENEMSLNKEEYISMVANGRYVMQDYIVDIDIQNLKIGSGAKSATFKSITTEKGKMPFPRDPKKPNDVEIVPIEGVSICEQRLIVSINNFIQMAKAECNTTISFDPFGSKPLVPR